MIVMIVDCGGGRYLDSFVGFTSWRDMLTLGCDNIHDISKGYRSVGVGMAVHAS